MNRIMLMVLLVVVSSSAMAEFTCEQISDKATRSSCIADREGKEKAAGKKERGKAVIAPECSLNQQGEASCSYSNTGNKRGSVCHYLKLIPNPAYSEVIIDAHKKIFAIAGDTSQKICSGIVEAGDVRERKILARFGILKSSPAGLFEGASWNWWEATTFVIVME